LTKAEHEFSLDLRKYAPEKWNGTVFFAAGNNHILADRMFTLTITGFNNSAAGNFITGRDVSAGAKAKFMPEPLHLPKVKNAPVFTADENAFRKWAKISALQPYGATEELTEKTAGYLRNSRLLER
ncbi:MAG: hypothetical protein J6S19_07505, partial [Lentisphaeria bacterium]|nr:hypothetical protein [Lentisphaeria bacterium]